MIKKDFYKKLEDGTDLYITYSDTNKTIIQKETGYEYDKAIDVENAHYTYEETENDITWDMEE